METPLVSVIIPSYGGGQNLERCVDSVLNQTYDNIECIVVDDNGIGTPNQLLTEQVMQKYVLDKRVIYICHDINKNASAARNTGVRNSKGIYISLLDDDDIFYCNNIQCHVETLQILSHDFALTYCGYDIYSGETKRGCHRAVFSGQDLYGNMMHKIDIPSSSFVIRKDVYEELGGFDETFRRHQDWEFIARMFSKYKVKALANIGYRRYLEDRNRPKSKDLAFKYRRYYLDTLLPMMSTLTETQKKDIIIENLLNVSNQFYFYDKNLKVFLGDYIKIKPGYRGLIYLFNRLKCVIYRKIKKGYE